MAISVRHADSLASENSKEGMLMPPFPLEEIRKAYENFKAVSDRCASTADYNAFADLFTEDCTYIEHAFGDMHGREEVRTWIVPLMKEYPINQMERYTPTTGFFSKRRTLASSFALGPTWPILEMAVRIRRPTGP